MGEAQTAKMQAAAPDNSFAPATGLTLQPDPAPMSSAQPVAQMDIEDPQSQPMDTLNETVGETLMRDVKMVGNKLKYVAFPRGGGIQELSRNWDLWGPLVLCLLLSMILSWN